MFEKSFNTVPIALSLVCRDQSGEAHQLGFRVPSDPEIRAFGHAFTEPCSKWGWSSFAEWEAHLDALPRGARIRPYTRKLSISDGTYAVGTHLTIARNLRTARVARAQAWISAPKASSLYGFVAESMHEILRCQFFSGGTSDYVLLPSAIREQRAA